MFLISPFGSYYYPVSSSYNKSVSVNTFTNVVRKQISSKLYSSPIKKPQNPFSKVFGKNSVSKEKTWSAVSCEFPVDGSVEKIKEYSDCIAKLSNAQETKK